MKKKTEWVEKQRAFFNKFAEKELEDEHNWKNNFFNPSVFIRRRDEDFLKFGIEEYLKEDRTLSKSISVLDVGSGRGELTLFLLQRGFKVSVLDNSMRSLKVLEKKAEILGFSRNLKKIICGTLENNITKIRNSFDYVVCYNFLHHVFNIEQTVGLMREAIKPGGHIVFIEPNGQYPLWRIYRSTSFFEWKYEKGILKCTKRNFEEILKRKGFNKITILPICFLPARIINKFPNLTEFLDTHLRKTIFRRFSTGIMGRAEKPIQ